ALRAPQPLRSAVCARLDSQNRGRELRRWPVDPALRLCHFSQAVRAAKCWPGWRADSAETVGTRPRALARSHAESRRSPRLRTGVTEEGAVASLDRRCLALDPAPRGRATRLATQLVRAARRVAVDGVHPAPARDLRAL